jgi:preprotein translocase SecE subunit
MESTKTKSIEKDSMSDDEESDRAEEVRRPSQAVVAPDGPGYFHIYKKGQGYWTRMGTVAGAGLLGLLTGDFFYTQAERILTGPSITPFLNAHHLSDPRGPFLIVALFAIAYTLVVFHYMNKPSSVDFLIATDSEMKKVNWTTQKELMGSTKIVIGFVFVMATLLFCYDLFFQSLFYLLHVLKTAPFFMGSH